MNGKETRFTVDFPPEVSELLTRHASNKGVSKKEFVRQSVILMSKLLEETEGELFDITITPKGGGIPVKIILAI